MMNSDIKQRFVFAGHAIRGLRVVLSNSYQETISHHHYPAVVQQQLGEFLVAATLMSSSLKYQGRLTLQARSQGQIPLIMAEATSKGTIRAIAQEATGASSNKFEKLFDGAQLAITIEPDNGQRYQGIVSADAATLSQALENYFTQSEQLSTKFWLTSNGDQAAGLMLQRLPSDQTQGESADLFWEHITLLTETITDIELLELETVNLLKKLYVEEDIQLFDANTISFECSCSKQRYANAIIKLGAEEINTLFDEDDSISVNCEFCNQAYELTREEILRDPGNNHPTDDVTQH